MCGESRTHGSDGGKGLMEDWIVETVETIGDFLVSSGIAGMAVFIIFVALIVGFFRFLAKSEDEYKMRYKACLHCMSKIRKEATVCRNCGRNV